MRATTADGDVLKHILLVEDHADTNRVLTMLLERKGYRVTSAASVASALECVRAGRFDLLISDIGLPDGTGLELIRLVHGICDLKGIALSGYGMEDDIRRSREAGFSEHLTKPVGARQLIDTAERLLGE